VSRPSSTYRAARRNAARVASRGTGFKFSVLWPRFILKSLKEKAK